MVYTGFLPEDIHSFASRETVAMFDRQGRNRGEPDDIGKTYTVLKAIKEPELEEHISEAPDASSLTLRI